MEGNTPQVIKIRKVSNGYIVKEKSFLRLEKKTKETKVFESIHTVMDYLLNNFNVADNEKTNQN